MLIDDTSRFDGVAVIGVDKRVWLHTRRGDNYVTVIIDLTPIPEGIEPGRLLNMVEGRSKQVFKDRLTEREKSWREKVEVVAMDGFTGFKNANAEKLPYAVAVMDPFHVAHLAGDALDACRCRVQQDTRGHRGWAGHPPLFGSPDPAHRCGPAHPQKAPAPGGTVRCREACRGRGDLGIYQPMITAYREPDRPRGREAMTPLITSVSHGVPGPLTEVITGGRTLAKGAADVLAYFNRPGTSNGPTEAI